MKTINISLRALSSPLSLLSIGLLLLNDHVLKVYYPSAITGKISDFAGLFFFSILLTVLFSTPLERLKLRPKQTAFIAYAITFAWFTLIKIDPQINRLTTDLLSWMLGFPTNIVLDPTDLIALLTLWPSWKLLQGIPAEGTFIPRRAYPVAALAILATMATSSIYIPPVEQVIEHDDRVYAFGRDLVTEPETDYAVSDDGGHTWQAIIKEEVPREVIVRVTEPVDLPKTVCLTSGETNCYRINDEAQVLAIEDSGQPWSVAWEIPPGRQILIKRTRFLGMQGLIPLDIAIVSDDQSHYVIAAMGAQGVLVGNANDEWKRIAVANSIPQPIPLDVDDLNSSFRVLQLELSVVLLIGNLTLLTLTTIFTTRLMAKDKYFHKHPEEKKEVRAPLLIFHGIPILIYSVVALIFTFPIISTFPVDEPIVVHFLIVIVFSLGSLATWSRLIIVTSFLQEARQLNRISVVVAIISLVVGIIPFILWTYGLIFNYNHAMTVSIMLFVGILYGALLRATPIIDKLNEESVEAS